MLEDRYYKQYHHSECLSIRFSGERKFQLTFPASSANTLKLAPKTQPKAVHVTPPFP